MIRSEKAKQQSPRTALVLLSLIAALTSSSPASAKRTAFVVGINSYDNLRSDLQLRKALNDSHAVAAALKQIGYQVVAAENTSRNDFLRAWQRFLNLTQPGDETALYFAGHGFEINGRNYLLVRDAPQVADGEVVLQESAIRVGYLIDTLKDKQTRVSVFILDACRDNPYRDPHSTRSLGSTRGLAREEAPTGTLIMMSAAAGQSALNSLSVDDPNPNSVYTRSLVPLLVQPGLEITDMAKRVRSNVQALAATVQHEQRPAIYDEMSGDYYLVPAPETLQAAIKAGTPMSQAAQAWEVTKDTTSQAVLETFIRKYGKSFYGEMARARLAEVKNMQTATLTPPASLPVMRPAPPTENPLQALDKAGQVWAGIKATRDTVVLESFIREFGNSNYASLARARLEQLKRERPAVASKTPPNAPSPGAASASSPIKPKPPQTSKAPSAYESAQAWLAVKETNSAANLEAFLSRHGESIYADAARARLKDIKQRSRVAVVAPVAPAPAAPGRATPAVVTPQVPTSSASSSTPLTPAQEHALKPGQVFKECAQCPQMRVLPAGQFTMGSPANEPGRSPEEGPPYRVTFSKQFAVGQFSVTFDEWDACVRAGGCNGYSPTSEGRRRGRYPVVNVSWNDAKAYVAWLSKTTGKSYRLLSEAEREYAARAGTTTPFWFGSSISTKLANYDGSATYADGKSGEFRGHTLPVDTFDANPFGLHQTNGNVYDWVEDCWHATYQGALQNGGARTTGDCGRRVLRGGSWYDAPAMLRAAHRSGFYPGYRSDKIGFRVARSL